jgi:hypothetical protein
MNLADAHLPVQGPKRTTGYGKTTEVVKAMRAKDLVRVLLKDQNPSITHVAVLATCGTGGHPGTIKDARATIRGRIEGKVAYNERNTRLGEYRDDKTYTAGGQLFGYGDLLSALIVNDAKRRGVWS